MLAQEPAAQNPAAKKAQERDWEEVNENRKFRPKWLSEFLWLRYNEPLDEESPGTMYCNWCRTHIGRIHLGKGSHSFRHDTLLDHQQKSDEHKKAAELHRKALADPTSLSAR